LISILRHAIIDMSEGDKMTKVFKVNVKLANGEQIVWYASAKTAYDVYHKMEELRSLGHFDVFDTFEVVN